MLQDSKLKRLEIQARGTLRMRGRDEARRSGSLACEPVAWNRPLRSLRGKLAMNDRAASRKLHRKPGIVLVVDDRARIAAQLRLAGNEIAERVDVLASDQALL